MRKLILVVLTLAILSFAGSSTAGLTNVGVTAQIAATCKFASEGSILFTLDPSAGGTVYGVITQPTFWCTKGTVYTISDDYGLHESGTQRNLRNTATPATDIPYSLTYTKTGLGGGKSAYSTMNLASSILQSAYINAPEGADYSDTITLTLNP